MEDEDKNSGMDTKIFKKAFAENCKALNLEKFKTSFFIESNDSIVFLILRKSGYSTTYYLRVKTDLKPLEEDFDREKYIKHDICDIFLSIDTELLELFDLENELSNELRLEKMQVFFKNNVANWIEILLSKQKIIEVFTKENYFLLPYTKSKLGIEEKKEM